MIAYSIPKYEKDIMVVGRRLLYEKWCHIEDGCLNNGNTDGYLSLNKDTKSDIIGIR